MSKRKRRKRIHAWKAWLIAVFLFGVTMLIGIYSISRMKTSFVTSVQEAEEKVEDRILEKLRSGDYEGIYETTSIMTDLKDSKAVYYNFLDEIFGDNRNGYELVEHVSDQPGYIYYRLFDGTEYLADIYRVEDTEAFAIPVKGNESYIVEVPAGAQVTMNGLVLENCLEKSVEASDFFAVSGLDFVPLVDIYQIDELIGEPELEVNGTTYTVVKDVMSNHLLAGREVESDMHDMVIEAAKALARYPAQDGTLGEVTTVSYTGSTWYQRYIGLQPYWFTAHDIMEISNEQVLKAVYQSEDTMVAHVVFDYFCDNGDGLSRTWNIGYQLTFVNIDGEWLICNTEIDCELNPNETPAE